MKMTNRTILALSLSFSLSCPLLSYTAPAGALPIHAREDQKSDSTNRQNSSAESSEASSQKTEPHFDSLPKTKTSQEKKQSTQNSKASADTSEASASEKAAAQKTESSIWPDPDLEHIDDLRGRNGQSDDLPFNQNEYAVMRSLRKQKEKLACAGADDPNDADCADDEEAKIEIEVASGWDPDEARSGSIMISDLDEKQTAVFWMKDEHTEMVLSDSALAHGSQKPAAESPAPALSQKIEAAPAKAVSSEMGDTGSVLFRLSDPLSNQMIFTHNPDSVSSLQKAGFVSSGATLSTLDLSAQLAKSGKLEEALNTYQKASEKAAKLKAEQEKEKAVTPMKQNKETEQSQTQKAASSFLLMDTLSSSLSKTFPRSMYGRLAAVSDGSRTIQIRIGMDGTPVSGEWKTAQGIEYYDPKTHERMTSSWVAESNENKLCYYDENGYQLRGAVCVNNKPYAFDPQTGGLLLDIDRLEESVQSLISKYRKKGEQIGFAFESIDTGQSIVLNSKAQQSASVMKAFVMGAIYDSYDEYAKKAGKDWLDYNLSVMISVSDNDAWVNLVTVLGNGNYEKGLSVLNSWNKKHGYTDTKMTGAAYGNFTSAKDASRLLADIENGVLKGSKEMKKLLQTQSVQGRLLQNLSASAKTANKPGWVPGCENDTMIVETPKSGTYVITLLCDDMTDTSRATSLMADLAPLVESWVKKNMPDLG